MDASVLSIHTVAHNYLELQFQEIKCPVLASTGTRHTQSAHTHIQVITHTHKIEINKFFFSKRMLLLSEEIAQWLGDHNAFAQDHNWIPSMHVK